MLHVREDGMGLGVISTAPRAFLVKTARKCVLHVKMVTTVSPSMASVRTVTLAGLGTGKKKNAHTRAHTQMCKEKSMLFCCLVFSFKYLTTSYYKTISGTVVMTMTHTSKL